MLEMTRRETELLIAAPLLQSLSPKLTPGKKLKVHLALLSHLLPQSRTFPLLHPYPAVISKASFCPIHGRTSFPPLSILHPPSFILLPRTHLVCVSADTLPPQIASHLYSVVLHAARRTDGSHSCLLNYARASLHSERAGRRGIM